MGLVYRAERDPVALLPRLAAIRALADSEKEALGFPARSCLSGRHRETPLDRDVRTNQWQLRSCRIYPVQWRLYVETAPMPCHPPPKLKTGDPKPSLDARKRMRRTLGKLSCRAPGPRLRLTIFRQFQRLEVFSWGAAAISGCRAMLGSTQISPAELAPLQTCNFIKGGGLTRRLPVCAGR